MKMLNLISFNFVSKGPIYNKAALMPCIYQRNTTERATGLAVM